MKNNKPIIVENYSTIKRHTVLKTTGATALGALSTQRVGATSTDTSTHFIEHGWSFNVEYPESYNEHASLMHIDGSLPRSHWRLQI